MKHNKGFSLIELVLVIVLLVILAVTGLSKFYNVSAESHVAARESVVSSIRTGVEIYRADDKFKNKKTEGSYPAKLDEVPASTPCNSEHPCFGNVLINPIDSGTWQKTGGNQYRHYAEGIDPSDYEYNPTDGSFGQGATP